MCRLGGYLDSPMMSSGRASEALSYLMVLEARSRTRMWKVWFMPPSKPGTHFMWKVSEDWLITEQFSTGSGATGNIFPVLGSYVRWKVRCVAFIIIENNFIHRRRITPSFCQD